MIGKSSVFDKEEWLDIPPIHDGTFEAGTTRRFHVMTKLARLTGLIRAVRENPEDSITARKAAALAEQLMVLDWAVSMP